MVLSEPPSLCCESLGRKRTETVPLFGDLFPGTYAERLPPLAIAPVGPARMGDLQQPQP